MECHFEGCRVEETVEGWTHEFWVVLLWLKSYEFIGLEKVGWRVFRLMTMLMLVWSEIYLGSDHQKSDVSDIPSNFKGKMIRFIMAFYLFPLMHSRKA